MAGVGSTVLLQPSEHNRDVLPLSSAKNKYTSTTKLYAGLEITQKRICD